MSRLQTFGNSAIQLTFFQDNDNSMPSWTISALSATFHHGQSMSLTFGHNKSAIFIHALKQPSTFTNISDPCQNHIIDCPPDARIAILTLRHHCALLIQDHVERTCDAFCSTKQGNQEVATLYLNQIQIQTRNCYHAGIPNTDAEIIKTNHPWRQQSPYLCCILPTV